MRDPATSAGGPASDVLRWGAGDLGDEDLWTAVTAALAEARDDGEYWRIGDGVVDESVRTRPALSERLWSRRESDSDVAELFRVMQDSSWNWTNADGWAEPKDWLSGNSDDPP